MALVTLVIYLVAAYVIVYLGRSLSTSPVVTTLLNVVAIIVALIGLYKFVIGL